MVDSHAAMLQPTPGLPEWIEVGLIDLVVRQELSDFWAEYEEPRFSVPQQLRTFAIEWLAVFVPARLSPVTAALIEGTVEAIRSREDYRWSGWHRALPLDVALFALTGESDWLDVARANVDHHNASLRQAVLDSLCLVADRLEFLDEQLRERVESNLRAHHLGAELGVLLLAATRGPLDQKRGLFSAWRGIDNAFARETLGGLVSGAPVRNELSEHIAWVSKYTLTRIAHAHSVRPPKAVMSPLLPAGDPVDMERRLTLAGAWRDLPYPSSLLAVSVSMHPLAAASVTLEGLPQDEDDNA
jgi:hypothetical protein